jgi:formylglycine-generating enzyme required for sulfatase activity
MDADDKQFAVIYPKFKGEGERGLAVLTGEIDRKLPPDAKEAAKEKLAKRQAKAAVALLRMNQPAKVWPLLKHSPDPRVRSYLIHRFGPLGTEPGAIVKRLEEEPDVTIRRALILSLGPEELSAEVWSPEGKQRLVQQLKELYRRAADSGLHAAAEWLLRQWQEEAWLRETDQAWAKDKERKGKRLAEIQEALTKETAQAKPQWYVNGQGQTMVVIPGPVEFMMGAPATEVSRQVYEVRHKRRIGRTFALATKAVTVEQYRHFAKGYPLPARYTRMAALPVVGTSWYQAAAYCNWLSREEGIPEDQWCYEVDAKGQVTKLKANYLSLTGYRLPTEAELEFATRAGALTSRYYGETEDLLPKYAWYSKNSEQKTWTVGSLKPNDLGLFDLHGNVFTWCQESYKDYPAPKGDEAIEDKEDTLSIVSTASRVLRGGSFGNPASNVRSADRDDYVPSYHSYYIGFRPARTCR